ncbi:MAG: hypothetical protein EP336_08325 [Rhodobacteraceae bacterium]|nr:MAG: hypothetical protein EP336_08325 [Paracoccaceae bacterium]
MTAILVTQTALSETEAAVGLQFNVRLSANGQEPASHLGCNWAGCPTEVVETLMVLEGVVIAEHWQELLTAEAVAVIAATGP